MAAVPLHVVVLGEARELLSALRRNRRFGYLLSFAAAAQPAEHPLVKEVKSLRDIVRSSRPAASVSSPARLLIAPSALASVLEPFLEVVKSRDASGIITSVALLSLDRIIAAVIPLATAAGVLPEYSAALGSIVDAAAACRFDATDPAADEVVLARITRVISRIVTSSAVPFLADASILRGVEACLGIAAGRRRASELLKRSADAALTDIFSSLAAALPTISTVAVDAAPTSSVISDNVTGVAFGYTLDVDAFHQRGPATVAVIAAVFELACKMADPLYARTNAERMLGTQLVSAVLGSGGRLLASVPALKKLILRDCSRALLRAVGSFESPPTIVAAAFTASAQLVHVLTKDGTTFLVSLLQRVYPYYISGYQDVLPRMSADSDSAPQADGTPGSTSQAGSTRLPSGVPGSSPPSNGGGPGRRDTDGGGSEIDPVVREIGLESLAELLATPGLLCAVYRVTDCDIRCSDVVGPLLTALGHASKSKRYRRRSKRLRASSSGSTRLSSSSLDVDSDEDDSGMGGGSGSPETARFARSAAMLCAESILAVVDTIGERLRLQSDGSAVTDASERGALEDCRTVRQEKIRMQRAADAFNASAKVTKATKLITLLSEHGLVGGQGETPSNVSEDLDGDVEAVVSFLRETPGLNKEKIGVILGEPDTISRRVLADYTSTFDFVDRPFTDSLRVFLESFRLPGESQKIDRIMFSFAQRYYDQNRPQGSSVLSRQQTDGSTAVTPISPASGPSVSSTAIAEVVDDGEPADASQPSQHRAENGSRDVALATGGPEEASLVNGVSDVDTAAHAEAASGDTKAASSAVHHSIGVMANADAAFVLSYAVVMLNTDQHNDSVRKKMTLDDFVRNNRKINGDADFPRWFLADIFESIAAVEIRMSDEVGISALTDLLWDEKLREVVQTGRVLPDIDGSQCFDEDVFVAGWQPAVVAANSVLNEAGDANSAQKALEGFLSVARCATAFRKSRPTEAVISALTTATTLREGPLHGAIVRFGTDIKAQMASVALSGVSRQCGDWLHSDGWQSLVAYILRLHALCLLPDDLERYLGGYGMDLVGADKKPLPVSRLVPSWWPSQAEKNSGVSKAEHTRSQKTVASRSGGFFAGLFAASIGADIDADDEDGDGDQEPPSYIEMRSAEDLEAQDLARKCIAGCRIEDIVINEAKVLRSEALQYLALSIARAAERIMDAGGIHPYVESTGSPLAVHSNGKARRSIGLSVTSLADAANGDPPGTTNESETRSSGREDLGNSSVLVWSEIAPPSPQHESSAIAGVAGMTRGAGFSVEPESDFGSFGGAPAWTGAVRQRDERKAREFLISFCIDMLCDLTLQNRDRLQIPWPALHSILVRVIAPTTRPSALLERAVVALLRVATRLLHREEVRDDVLRSLNLLVRLPAETAEALSVPIAGGVYNIVRSHGTHIRSTSGWHAILSITENTARYSSEAREIGLQTMSVLLSDKASSDTVFAETYAPVLDTVLAYVTCPSVEVSIKALDLMYLLSQRIPGLASASGSSRASGSTGTGNEQDEASRVWGEFWGPILRGFAAAARDSRGKVRNSALASLEKVIATGGSAEFLSASQWKMALSTVLLPLMNQLFTTYGLFKATIEAERAAQRKLLAERSAAAVLNGRGRNRSVSVAADHGEQLTRSVMAACNRTRLRAVMLTSKTFLQHHAAIARGLPEEEFTDLWLGVLDVFCVAVKSGSQGIEDGWFTEQRPTETDELVEHVPESVKNLLLVMCDCGLLAKEQHVRWNATFAMVRSFLPDIEETITIATNPPALPDSEPASTMESESTDGSIEANEGTAAPPATPAVPV